VTGFLAIPASSVAGAITPPSVEYGQLSPMLVVFGVSIPPAVMEADAVLASEKVEPPTNPVEPMTRLPEVTVVMPV